MWKEVQTNVWMNQCGPVTIKLHLQRQAVGWSLPNPGLIHSNGQIKCYWLSFLCGFLECVLHWLYAYTPKEIFAARIFLRQEKYLGHMTYIIPWPDNIFSYKSKWITLPMWYTQAQHETSFLHILFWIALSWLSSIQNYSPGSRVKNGDRKMKKKKKETEIGETYLTT